MGLFKRLFEPESTKELRETVDDLKIEMRRLQEEWTDVYNKFRNLQMRVARQTKAIDANSSQEETTGGWGLEVLQPLNYLAKFSFLCGCDVLAGGCGDTEDLEEHGRPEGNR